MSANDRQVGGIHYQMPNNGLEHWGIPHDIIKELSKVRISDKECWEYLGSKRGQMGYAQFSSSVGSGSRSGHREVFLAFYGEIPKGMDVGHTCDVPACINPKHLVLQTRQQNLEQMVARKRNVSNWNKATIKPGTQEFSSRVREGVTSWWASMTDKQRKEMGKRISEGKKNVRK